MSLLIPESFIAAMVTANATRDIIAAIRIRDRAIRALPAWVRFRRQTNPQRAAQSRRGNDLE